MFKIEEAAREGAKVVIGLAGVSGGGKTFTALQLAYGLANRDASKVGFLDTENRRGRLYADSLPGKAKFKIADLIAPFHPKRYIEGLEAFEQSGCEVLIIDSISHSWAGIGGCDDIANEGNPRTPRWNIAKAANKALVNHLLQSSMHLIVCLRAQEKVKMKPGQNGKVEYEALGLQPICEKSFPFELTVSLLMEDEGKKQTPLKCPAELRQILGRGQGYITVEDGKNLRAWIDGANPVDREMERHRSALMNACEWGLKTLEETWKALPTPAKQALKDELPALKASAEAYDRQSAIAAPEPEAANP
jgi:hypothetical protein